MVLVSYDYIFLYFTGYLFNSSFWKTRQGGSSSIKLWNKKILLKVILFYFHYFYTKTKSIGIWNEHDWINYFVQRHISTEIHVPTVKPSLWQMLLHTALLQALRLDRISWLTILLLSIKNIFILSMHIKVVWKGSLSATIPLFSFFNSTFHI